MLVQIGNHGTQTNEISTEKLDDALKHIKIAKATGCNKVAPALIKCIRQYVLEEKLCFHCNKIKDLINFENYRRNTLLYTAI